jgi:hypothetical protein
MADNSAKTEQSQSITRYEPVWDENGKSHWEKIKTERRENNAQAILLAPPTKVIPVIFLPGVMGTNLMSDKAVSEEPVWRGDSDIKVFFGWSSKSGEQRRSLLNPDTTKVDNRGKISTEIFSPITDDGGLFPTRSQRGWGEVLYFSYGKFLSVFQGALLDDWQQWIKKQIDLNQPQKTSKDRKGILTSLVN